jgi:hypothetical protein
MKSNGQASDDDWVWNLGPKVPTDTPPKPPVEQVPSGPPAPSTTGLPALTLNPKLYRYFVDALLPIKTEDLDCILTPGATLVVPVPPQPGEKAVDVIVELPNTGDCASGARFQVSIERLIEMSNMHEFTIHVANQNIERILLQNGAAAPPVGAVERMPLGVPSANLTADAPSLIGEQEQTANALTKSLAEKPEFDAIRQPGKPR